ncbi:hypothetical protein ACFSL6_27210, partial [Paenibacillus thailandensis]|uniref:hypothetical protein n=1 Tax=Paenibacillus thailandensis TaxID=393250 RepID=UPI00363859E6
MTKRARAHGDNGRVLSAGIVRTACVLALTLCPALHKGSGRREIRGDRYQELRNEWTAVRIRQFRGELARNGLRFAIWARRSIVFQVYATKTGVM